MGTRADFYIGRGASAEWIGSIAWDGYPGGVGGGKKTQHGRAALASTSADEFRKHATAFIENREDGTKPAYGWPWPWEDSNTTDYAYAFDDGCVWASCFGSPWWKAADKEPEDHDEQEGEKPVFPNMKDKQNVTLGKRSGVIVIGG
jgi:hypothetical protein